jgi:hypothetical protein
MEFDIKAIDFDADVYDVRKAVELVLHGPDLYDPNDPKNKGRKPNFEVILGESPAGRIHDGTGILRVTNIVGNRLHQWIRDSDNKNKIVVKGRTLRLFRASRKVSPLVKQQLEKALYVGPEKEKQRKDIESQARGVRPRIAKVQFGVWHRQPNSPPNHGRDFSIEYERDFLSRSEAYVSVVYEHKLICVEVGILLLVEPQLYLTFHFTQIGQRETEENNYMILVKFSSIRKLGIGNDDFGQPCKGSSYYNIRNLTADDYTQSSYSIYMFPLSLRGKALMPRNPETDNASTTKRGIAWLRLMMHMLVLHHMLITYVSSSLNKAVLTSSEKYATSWNANLVPSALLVYLPTKSSSSSGTNSTNWSAG